MKKFTTLCLSLLLSATTFAQTEPGTFSLQPKVGINVSTSFHLMEIMEQKPDLYLEQRPTTSLTSCFPSRLAPFTLNKAPNKVLMGLT